MGRLTKKQKLENSNKIFIEEMANGSSREQAVLKAFPNTKPTTSALKQKAYNLLRKDEISNEIVTLLQEKLPLDDANGVLIEKVKKEEGINALKLYYDLLGLNNKKLSIESKSMNINIDIDMDAIRGAIEKHEKERS